MKILFWQKIAFHHISSPPSMFWARKKSSQIYRMQSRQANTFEDIILISQLNKTIIKNNIYSSQVLSLIILYNLTVQLFGQSFMFPNFWNCIFLRTKVELNRLIPHFSRKSRLIWPEIRFAQLYRQSSLSLSAECKF